MPSNTKLAIFRRRKVRKTLYQNVKDILINARHNAYRAVNFIMVEAYWNVGRLIVEEEQKGKQKANYGAYLLRDLSARLTEDMGEGFSEQSLRNMRQFYILFPIRSTLWSELSWSHYKLLIRVENENARRFYGQEAVKGNWSVRVLERQVYSHYYERLLSSRIKSSVIIESSKTARKNVSHPKDFIKDPYVLEFLDLKSSISYQEKEIESALIDKLQQFLLELGRGFSFVARQQRMSTETSEFYIDLVFYNYILKCFVLIDLKIGKLAHQDIGQMDMYVRLYEDKMRNNGDNPTIGLILCEEKEETVVKYSVLKGSKKLFASKYKLYLPSEQELIEELDRERQNLRLMQKGGF